ncbi:MAG TPA: chromosomal replication initiator protein DnaA [Trueperaceae bacterium]
MVAGQDRGIWDDLMQVVRQRIPEVEFRTWFHQVTPLGFVDGAYVMGVPHTFARDWLRSKYTQVLEVALAEIGAQPPRVAFQVTGSRGAEQQDLFGGVVGGSDAAGKQDAPGKKDGPGKRGAPGGKEASAGKASSAASAGRVPRARQADDAAPESGRTDPNGAAQPQGPGRVLPQLNPKYVFANFVVGPNNHLATAAARAVAASPGQTYNPLFLYGESGLGKTHLMQAVGHAVIEAFPHMTVEYVTTEKFTNDLIDAIQDKQMAQFRDRYRNTDVLLIDDIQFLAGKERTQEEFFHTFNTLYELGKQIIVSSDRPPKDIPTLEKRLRSRFEWGLITDVSPPELETRMAILRMNAEYRGVKLPQDVVDYIARHVTSNIRELEGALVRTIVYASMNQVPLNRQTAAKALSEVFAPSEESLTMPDILAKVAKHFGVDPDAVRGKGRRKELVVPRQVAMYLIRELTTHSFPEIGRFFADRDHSTVMYAVQKVTEAIEEDSELDRVVRSLRDSLV